MIAPQKVVLPLASGLALALMALTSTSVVAENLWTLESSIQRMLQLAPETRVADASINMHETRLAEAEVWPNPSVELRVDEKLGLNDGSGGLDVTQLVITQPLPFKRLQHQRMAAQASLSSAQSDKNFQRLQLEYEMARVFHRLQWTAAELALSEQRLETAHQFQGTASGKKDLLVRYLSPLERQRLDILRETARQSIATAEGEYNEALARFRTLLALDENTSPQLVPLTLMDQPGSLQALQRGLEEHPQLVAIKHEIEAAQAGVDLARATRFADPTLNLFWEQDNFSTGRENYNGVSLNFEIPLWNASKARISSARSEAIRARSLLELQQRDLTSQLHQSYIHLGHLINQSQAYRDKLLKPARVVFELTRKGFEAGEQNLLSLIDANNTYFDSRSGYLKLLANVGYELAQLRLAAGLTILSSETETQGVLK